MYVEGHKEDAHLSQEEIKKSICKAKERQNHSISIPLEKWRYTTEKQLKIERVF